jgi:hypothetical protein
MKTLIALVLAGFAFITQTASGQDRNLATAKTSTGFGEERVALVLGNSAYTSAPLTNPVNDARAMVRVLRETGFKVISKENAGQKEMQLALREFGDALSNGGVGLFYYAGHGMQIKGRNYLIPVDARFEREDEVAYGSLDANQVLDKMDAAGSRLNIVILDACRNNPFPRSVRSAGSGLAQMEAPVGTLIAFSTAPGSVASDGSGKNGLYTQYLLATIKLPGINIEDVFKRVRTNVRRDTDGQQIPWESTSLEGDFVFVPQPPKPSAALAGQSAKAPAKPIAEIAAPILTVGDTWSFQRVDLFSGSIIGQSTLKLKAISADEWDFDQRVYDKSWNLLRVLKDGKVVSKWSPRRPNYDFPLRPGKAWEATGVLDNEKYSSSEHKVGFRVLRQERVLVPAGIFDALRVEGAGKYKSVDRKGRSGEGTVTHRYWFSPEVGNIVAYEYEETNWKGVLHRKERSELLAYQRAR